MTNAIAIDNNPKEWPKRTLSHERFNNYEVFMLHLREYDKFYVQFVKCTDKWCHFG